MTNNELINKILEAEDKEWFENVSVNLSFKLSEPLSLKGLSAIYKFINQQADGWSKYDNLPGELEQSKSYFNNVENNIISFVNNYYSYDRHYLQQRWTDVNKKIQNSQYALLYNISEVDFLIDLYKNNQAYFSGAYNILLGTGYIDFKYPDNFYGSVLAYEFKLKDHTNITERRNAEKKSISTIRSDFQKYLSESENHLITHLKNANTNYSDYVKRIDDLKIEKDKQFSEWFEDTKKERWNKWFESTKNEQWSTWFEDTLKKISDLEVTYREKLKLEEPAKYWEERSSKMRKHGKWYLGFLVVFVMIICTILVSVLWNPPEIINESILNGDMLITIKWFLMFGTLVSFFAYGIRVLSRAMFSSFHLARDCEERYTLTYFYLSLLKDSSVDEKDRHLIMQSLFSRADTGLLKEDSSPTMPNDIINKVISS